MNKTLFPGLLLDFWSDLNAPGMGWQIGALALCLLAAWVLSRGLQRAMRGREVQLRVVRLGVESFSRVLAPVLALGLIMLAKLLLAKTHHVNLLRIAIPLIASFALIRLAFYVLRRIFARGGTASEALLMFEKIFALLVWGGVALYITGVWPDLIAAMDDTFLPMGRYKISVLSIVQAMASVLVTLIFALWIGALLEERLMHVKGMHSSLRTVLARLCRAVLILIAILVSLSLVGIDLTVLSVFGGALGVGIGLGLQKIISSYVSGFVILLERGLAIGDMVTVDKYYGRVTKINARYTVIRSLDGIETVVPNDMLISGPVQNSSLSDRLLRLSTHVAIGYDSDVDAVIGILERAVATIARVSDELPPQVSLTKFGADGFELEIGFWIADPENGRINVLSDVNRVVWRAFSANNIEIPYPQREVRFVGAAPVGASATGLQPASNEGL